MRNRAQLIPEADAALMIDYRESGHRDRTWRVVLSCRVRIGRVWVRAMQGAAREARRGRRRRLVRRTEFQTFRASARRGPGAGSNMGRTRTSLGPRNSKKRRLMLMRVPEDAGPPNVRGRGAVKDSESAIGGRAGARESGGTGRGKANLEQGKQVRDVGGFRQIQTG